MREKNNVVVFTGGGTGGHIYPGLAIADTLKSLDPKCSVVWLGSNNGSDKKSVLSNRGKDDSQTCSRFIAIPSGKLRRYFSFMNFIDLFKIGFGFIAAFFVLLRIRPRFVFSKGGFVSVPPCVAAKILKIPVYTHECDFSPGLATKLNVKFAKKVLVSYEETKRFFAANVQEKVLVTGNPIREVFFATEKQIGFDFLALEKRDKPILIVLGGSSGAHQINELIFENLDWLVEHFIVVHQTGKGTDFATACERQKVMSTGTYKPYDFIYTEMPHVLSCADIVLSRSGANSLWECVATEKPMILIPLTGSGTRGDQVENAHFFENCGAALVLDSSKSIKDIGTELSLLVENQLNSDVLENMKKSLRQMAKENPAKGIARFLVAGE